MNPKTGSPLGVAATFVAFVAVLMMPVYAWGKHVPDTSMHLRSFIVADANGGKLDVAQQKGKVVFINFWALTCIPCKAEMPTINNLKHHYQNDNSLIVLPVDLDRDFANDAHFFAQNHYTLPIYAPAGVVPQELFAGELPTTVLIDKSGGVFFFHAGEGQYDSPSFFALVDSLLSR